MSILALLGILLAVFILSLIFHGNALAYLAGVGLLILFLGVLITRFMKSLLERGRELAANVKIGRAKRQELLNRLTTLCRSVQRMKDRFIPE